MIVLTRSVSNVGQIERRCAALAVPLPAGDRGDEHRADLVESMGAPRRGRWSSAADSSAVART